MDASSDEPRKHQSTCFQLHKRATLPHGPLRHKQTKDSQAGKIVFYACKVRNFAYQLCTKQRAICAPSNEFEASIDLFTVAQEGDVAHRPLRHEQTRDSQVGNFVCL